MQEMFSVKKFVASNGRVVWAVPKMFSVKKFVASNGRIIWSWLFLIVGAFSFMSFACAAVISKLQPPTHSIIIRAIEMIVYFHWLSMKLFKHA